MYSNSINLIFYSTIPHSCMYTAQFTYVTCTLFAGPGPGMAPMGHAAGPPPHHHMDSGFNHRPPLRHTGPGQIMPGPGPRMSGPGLRMTGPGPRMGGPGPRMAGPGPRMAGPGPRMAGARMPLSEEEFYNIKKKMIQSEERRFVPC